jgi:hypothetical protein
VSFGEIFPEKAMGYISDHNADEQVMITERSNASRFNR